MRKQRTPMLGRELCDARERRGLSIRELSAESGVSREAISAIERGDRYPSLQTLEALAHALNISVIIGPDETVVEAED
jgi:transcriptional regulator with XRE-family HTH domain